MVILRHRRAASILLIGRGPIGAAIESALLGNGHTSCGQIPTVLRNGLFARVTTIIGSIATLRDYVWVGDLARHVVGHIADDGLIDGEGGELRVVEALAAGVPTSRIQIKTLAERLLRRRIYVACSPLPENARDITYRQSCWPRHLPRRSMLEGMTEIRSDLLRRGGALL